MAGYELNADDNLLPDLLSGENGLARLMEFPDKLAPYSGGTFPVGDKPRGERSSNRWRSQRHGCKAIVRRCLLPTPKHLQLHKRPASSANISPATSIRNLT
jgi:hypothetical protein